MNLRMSQKEQLHSNMRRRCAVKEGGELNDNDGEKGCAQQLLGRKSHKKLEAKPRFGVAQQAC